MLQPVAVERLTLPSGRQVSVAKATPQFELWHGDPVVDNYNGKPILMWNNRPAFAELVVLRMLQSEGWDGVWANTYGERSFLTEYWPKNAVELPAAQQRALEPLLTNRRPAAGCWDVLAWKGNEYLFLECKRNRKDKLRPSQLQWLEKALESGFSLASFELVEWTLVR